MNSIEDLIHHSEPVACLADKILDMVREPLLVLDRDHRIVWANRAFYSHFAHSNNAVQKRCIYELEDGRWNVGPLRALLEEVLGQGIEKRDVEIVCGKDSDMLKRTLLVHAQRLQLQEYVSPVIVLGIDDITAQRSTERELSEYRSHLERKVQQRTLELEKANRQLRRLATLDELTGLSNRHLFNRTIEHEWARARRENIALSILLIDIDQFKAYNDTFGHQQGDDCLYQVATTMQRHLQRPSDFIARYGGEEFIAILPGTPLAGALRAGEKLRMAVETLHLPTGNTSVSPWVTISIGTATCVPDKTHGFHDLIKAADNALYSAKNRGRNRVVASGEEITITKTESQVRESNERRQSDRRKGVMR